MSSEEGLVALLHVSAAVAALGAAYAGLDRSSVGRPLSDTAFAKARELAKQLMQALGLKNHTSENIMLSKRWGHITITYPVSVICVVADEPLKVQWIHRIGQWIYRQKHIPLFQYYRRHLDRIVAGAIGSVAFLLFFVIAWSLIWKNAILENDAFEKTAFDVMSACVFFLVAQAIISLEISEKRTMKQCETLYQLTDARLIALLQNAEGTVQEFKSGDPPTT